MSLRRFILKRFLAIIPILFGVSVITFALVHYTPGDPVQQMVGLNPDMTAAEEQAIRRRYGLHRPAHEQYFHWIANVLQGDFGQVYSSGRDVGSIVLMRLPETIALGIFGWVFALGIAIPTGIYAAVKKDQLGDTVSRFLALSGISIPNFWLGLMLILFFALILDLWPVLPPSRQPLYSPEMLWYLILPGVTVGTASAAAIMRVMRTSMAEEMNKDYVTAARAKGLPERKVVLKHVLRNSLISVVTLAALLTAGIVSGSIVVEVVFNWPGLGREFINALTQNEIDLIMAITLVTGVAIIIANLVADIMYAVLDPRIRYD
ncbi:ABC-type dipeptide/oligopeptide/nickel transportsystem, permease component [Halalkaliarchaeum sp. AArc-CO]|uniref:ABC transporter permease n=1 Tax=unclassified Halalkaliarchaeum TaxID=2678344 RepID=UPI00217D438F|nr:MULTISPECIES: ABC transporter permease [unclassified Halalkaliarchaeum]MDR5671599.1 ABC transporter permease [Halalkaliarchaeum sp. AArc-GB]UWG51101.1 ABC-type dipeptide/oligopeptide/nickel transportsystem, permease component [Halalkaliarchaeum sp. AArc-CO]